MVLIILACLIVLIGIGFGGLLAMFPAELVSLPMILVVALLIGGGISLVIWEIPHHRLDRRVRLLKDASFWLASDEFKVRRFDFEAFLHSIGARFAVVSDHRQGYISCHVGKTKYTLESYWADELTPELKAAMDAFLSTGAEQNSTPSEAGAYDSSESSPKKPQSHEDVYLVTIFTCQTGRKGNREQRFYPSDGELVHDGGEHPHACVTAQAFAIWHNAVLTASRQPH